MNKESSNKGLYEKIKEKIYFGIAMSTGLSYIYLSFKIAIWPFWFIYINEKDIKKEWELYRKMPAQIETQYGICNKIGTKEYKTKWDVIKESLLDIPKPYVYKFYPDNPRKGMGWISTVDDKPYLCKLPDGTTIKIAVKDVPPTKAKEVLENRIEEYLKIEQYITGIYENVKNMFKKVVDRVKGGIERK